MNTLLQGENVSRIFHQGGTAVRALDGVDIEIYENDFTVIMGASGAGKSTLLYSLSGMDRISEGKVFYKGTEISALYEKDLARIRAEEFGFIFQQPNLVSNLTLYENVAVAGYVSGKGTTDEIRNKTSRLLNQMHVEEAQNRFPSQVSGGEAQRSAIARAMIGDPGLLFADEPTGALNKSNTTEALNLLTDLNRTGQSILMVTHDMRAAVRGNRILYIEDGKALDELKLPPYSNIQEKQREVQVGTWLSGLRW